MVLQALFVLSQPSESQSVPLSQLPFEQTKTLLFSHLVSPWVQGEVISVLQVLSELHPFSQS